MGCLVVMLAFVGLSVVVGVSGIGSLSRGPAAVGTKKGTSQNAEQFTARTAQLELVRFHSHVEYGYAILEGQVKNVSSESLKNVEAVGSYYDAAGGFITSSQSLIAYNPILPGQTSAFKVMTTANPAMKGVSVDFKYLMGGTIACRRPESKKLFK